MPRFVSFPHTEPQFDFDRVSVQFYAISDGTEVLKCLVSGEALEQHFGAKDRTKDECLRAFNENRTAIEAAARRKIMEGEYKRGDEVILRRADFPRETTTTTPPPEMSGRGRVRTRTTPDIQNNPELLKTVQRATRILDEEIIQDNAPVSARWAAVDTFSGPILDLLLQDEQTGVTTARVFIPSEFASESASRFSLFRLWDDLLRQKGAFIIKDLQKAPYGEDVR